MPVPGALLSRGGGALLLIPKLISTCWVRIKPASLLGWTAFSHSAPLLWLALAACSPNKEAETSSTSKKSSIQEVFISSQTQNGTAFK